ncbi:MAG: YdcF family protein [Opitutae bacterium]|nr:YdcF family protein [Opitutae bacterium]
MPESLAADAAGRPTDQPSFAFRQVLEQVLKLAGADDRVYLAPANSFGGAVTEEQAAYHFLRSRQAAGRLLCPGLTLPAVVGRPDYLDTWGNAILLRQVLDRPEAAFELVTTQLHAARARWCFAQAGFRVSRVHAVRYAVEPGRVMRRNFYYRYPRLHWCYEVLALWRDRLKYGHRAGGG